MAERSDAEFEHMLGTMKKAGAALNDAAIPWALGGGLACWARGGPETEHDVDLLVKPEDAERAQEALELVQAQTWGKGAHLDGHGALITLAPGNRGRDLNLFLIKAGFAPDLLTQATQDLEEVFLRLTNGGTGGVQ